MDESQKVSIIKLVIGIMILALLLSIKTVLFINLESLGLNYYEANSLREAWTAWNGDIIFLLASALLSLVIGLKFNIKGD